MFSQAINTPEFLISKKNPVYFIAEIGGNHEGNYHYALEMLHLAFKANVDAVKFQILRGDSLVSPIESSGRNKHFKKFELNRKQFESLAQICKDHDTDFIASVWDPDSITWVNEIVPFHKVGSGDLTAFPFLRELTKTKKPILLSTGLSNIFEIQRTVDFIKKCDPGYIEQNKLVLMQCTSSYPNQDQDANLLVIRTLYEDFSLPVGYSDHTYGTDAAYIATLLGSQVLELHFTDTREGKSFRDHQISVTWEEVCVLMKRIKRAKELLGSPEKKATNSEINSGHIKSFRRAIYAARDIDAGTQLSLDNLSLLRPEHGIPAWRFDEVVGCKLGNSKKKNEPIQEPDVVWS